MTWSEIANLKGGSNPNLLDNWYFGDPINQRGQTKYDLTTARTYHIDRWLSELGLANRSIEIVKPTADDVGHLHIVTNEVRGKGEALLMAQFPDKYVGQVSQGQSFTLSLIYRTSCNTVFLMTYSSGEDVSSMKLPKSDDWNLATLTFEKADGLIAQDHVRISTYMNEVDDTDEEKWIDLHAIKLEQSDHQTLAEQTADGTWRLLDAPPNKALELLKCQRYQVVFGDSANAWQSLGIGIAAVADKVNVLVPIPLQLRANPAVRVTSNSAFLLQGMGENITAGSIVFSRMTPACVQLTVDATGAALGDVYMLRQGEDKTAQLILDANL